MNAPFVDREKDDLESSDESETEMETEVESGKPAGNVATPVAPVKTKYDLMMKSEVSLCAAASFESVVMEGVVLWSHMIQPECIC